jgi:hypothetical protein
VEVAKALSQTLTRPETLFLSGDGALLYPLRDALGSDTTRLEAFFNNPEKKST